MYKDCCTKTWCFHGIKHIYQYTNKVILMKKNVIWWPALKNPNHLDKYGGCDYYEYSKKSWEYWCKKNDCIFVPFTEPIHDDFT